MKLTIPKKWTSNIILAVLFFTTTVVAQPASTPPKPDAEVKFRKASQLTAEEQLRQGQSYLTKMNSTHARVGKMAKKARGEKDIIKLNCVNDKLIQIKGHLNLGERTLEALKMATRRQDPGSRNHEFAKLTITYQKVVVLGQEAEACIGEDISYVGKTRVEVDIDKDIPDVDPTTRPPSPPPVVRPPLASPFL